MLTIRLLWLFVRTKITVLNKTETEIAINDHALLMSKALP